MEENKKISEQRLLYDPLFDKKPDLSLPDDPSKGILGKTLLKKVLFIVVIVSFISISLFMSFYSVSADTYEFKENGNGYLLSSFKGQENDYFLFVDYVTDGETVDTSKAVNEIRSFAISCNEYLEYIYISEAVEKINPNAFYSCTALRAVNVHPDNPNYASVDGVLYEKSNGVLTKIIQYPNRNGIYRSALALGIDPPESNEDYEDFKKLCDEKSEEIEKEFAVTGKKYEIKDTVTVIGELCFADCKDIEIISVPDSITEIETMAFFKCEALKSIYLPDGLRYIGSDAFSSCKSVKYLFIPASVTEIGHHAFHKCESISKVFMGHENDEGIELGDQWAPQTRKVVMISVDVLYNQKREVK